MSPRQVAGQLGAIALIALAITGFAQDPPVPDEAMTCDQIALQLDAYRQGIAPPSALSAGVDRDKAARAEPLARARPAPADRPQRLAQLARDKRCARIDASRNEPRS